MDSIYELQADLCKVFSNAKRIEILDTLSDSEMSSGELAKRTRLNNANLSQHMAVLKARGVVISRREGVNIYYRIADPKINEARSLMRAVLLNQLRTKGEIAYNLENVA
jgi:ArsR family transcriptional regulator